jgi:hypothetical protein
VGGITAVGDRLLAVATWLRAGCFETLAEDLRIVLRLAAGRPAQPKAAIISRTLRSTPESGARGAYDGTKRKKGSKLHWPSTPSAICWRCTSRRQRR